MGVGVGSVFYGLGPNEVQFKKCIEDWSDDGMGSDLYVSEGDES